ncbi:MAG TPA: transporter [Burkholderiaceae bacterium]|nr:transporter [Burkholderiaceae bacterium]
MDSRFRSIGSAAALAALTLPTGAAQAADGDGFAPITPYRPSVSSPAQLPAPGQIELEFGGLRQRSDDARHSSLPYLFKLAFDASWGLLLGGEARVWQRDGGARAQGLGDTSVVLKRAWLVDEGSAFGVELGAKLPTANDTIGSGHADYSINTIYSRDFGALHMDANLNALRFGRVDAGTSRTQWGASASFSTALAEHWGATGELSGTRRTGVDHGAQLLAALAYSPSKFLTIDFGIARSPRPAPATTSLFAGVVFPLARLW